MIQLYNEKFTLDLSNENVQFSETNGWIDGKGFIQYSIPFTLNWINDNQFFHFLLSSNPVRLYNCWMTLEGKIRKAELEILEFDGKTVELTIYYGLNRLPGETKLMKDFNFPIIQTVGIFDYAESVIDKNIDETNINFPQIIKEYSADDEGFENYPGVLNYNDIDDGYDISGQVLRPYPYLLYVLKHCFSELGYNAEGSFFENEHLKEALFVTHNEFHFLGGGPEITEYLLPEDIVSTTDVITGGQTANVQHFRKSIPPNIILYSNINLYFLVPAGYDLMGFDVEVIVSCGGIQMHQQTFSSFNSVNGNVGSDGFISVLVNQSLLPQQIGHPVVVEWKLHKAWEDEDLTDKFRVKIYPLTASASPTSQPLTVVNPNHIDIGKLFPTDMTFGDYFELVNASCKPVVSFSNSVVKMELGNKIIDNRRVVDLTKYESKFPSRSFDSKTTFEIKYQGSDEDADNDNKMFIEYGNIQLNTYVINDNTEEIELALQPLFFDTLGNVHSANVKNGLAANVVFYNFSKTQYSCINKLNRVEDWYDFFLKEYIRFKLNPEVLKFGFIEDYRILGPFEADSFIFINKSLYLIKEIEKKQLQPYLLEYEIEAVKLLT